MQNKWTKIAKDSYKQQQYNYEATKRSCEMGLLELLASKSLYCCHLEYTQKLYFT
jgi:hypothetical protein